MPEFLARWYEPLLGRMLAGVRRTALALGPPHPGIRVVDVGCGTGEMLTRYAAAGCRVAGVDLSASMLFEARRRLGPGALLALAEATALPFPSDGADLVLATMVLHGLPADSRVPALAEMARVAGKRGRVLVADHRPERERGAWPLLARGVARAVEGIAGHGPGVRSLLAAGGVAGLAARAGLRVEAVGMAAGGTISVTRLRPIVPVDR
jgi:ubiquinone/menaquinone biosynthesis C-methylase UbiE